MMSNPSRTRLIGIAILAATFLAGGFSGAAIDRWGSVTSPAPQSKAAPQAPDQEAAQPDKPHGSIFDLLDLSTTQRAAIDSILRDGRERVEAWRKETEPQYRALVGQTRTEVRAVMTPEQIAKYDRLRAEHRAKMRSGDSNSGGKGASAHSGCEGGANSGNNKCGNKIESKETRI